jgi:hypothetical protein
MNEYIITIVPVTDDLAAQPAQTLVRVATDGTDFTIKELVVRAPEGAGIATGDLPRVDFGLLLQALGASGAAPSRRTAATASPPVPPNVGSAPAESTPRRASRRASAPGRATEHLTAGRAYRRAPDLDELEDVYLRVGTIAGVAAHFEVPVHTAQGWITRMRRRNSSSTTES